MRNTAGQPVRTKQDIEREQQYQAEDDLRTLQRAAEVKADEGRMKRAMALHEKQNKGMESMAGKEKTK